MKRLNQIGIVARKFRRPYAEIFDAALSLDEAVFNAAEDVLRLRDCLPNEDEFARLEARAAEAAADGSASPLPPSAAAARGLSEEENLVLRLARVPRMAERLDCFATRLNIDSRANDVRGQVRALADAADGLLADSVVPIALAITLRVGLSLIHI